LYVWTLQTQERLKTQKGPQLANIEIKTKLILGNAEQVVKQDHCICQAQLGILVAAGKRKNTQNFLFHNLPCPSRSDRLLVIAVLLYLLCYVPNVRDIVF
jgi:hypothetical protein